MKWTIGKKYRKIEQEHRHQWMLLLRYFRFFFLWGDNEDVWAENHKFGAILLKD